MAIDNTIGNAFLETLLTTERMPDDDLIAHQAELLGALYRHAVSEVPAYRHRTAPPTAFDTNAAFWTEQPFLTKADIAQDPQTYFARNVPENHGAVTLVTSGGSTGQPVARRTTALESLGRTIGFYRGLIAWNFDYSTPLMLIRTEQFARHFEKDGDTSAPAERPLPALLGKVDHAIQYFTDIRTPASGQLQRLRAVAPVNVNTLPSNILRLGLAARKEEPAPMIPFIMAIGEYLPHEVRSLARAAFGSRIIDVISSAEAGNIAIECPVSGLYHIQSELVLAEILSADGSPCSVGEVGELVVTPLYNYASPLLRYRSGDYVERGPKCPCGRTLPTIARFVGRKEHMFVFPDGRRMLPPIDRVAICDAVGHEEWVFVQTQSRQSELRVARLDDLDREKQLQLQALLAQYTERSFAIVLQSVDTLPLTSGAKRHFTLNLYDAA